MILVNSNIQPVTSLKDELTPSQVFFNNFIYFSGIPVLVLRNISFTLKMWLKMFLWIYLTMQVVRLQDFLLLPYISSFGH